MELEFLTFLLDGGATAILIVVLWMLWKRHILLQDKQLEILEKLINEKDKECA